MGVRIWITLEPLQFFFDTPIDIIQGHLRYREPRRVFWKCHQGTKQEYTGTRLDTMSRQSFHVDVRTQSLFFLAQIYFLENIN